MPSSLPTEEKAISQKNSKMFNGEIVLTILSQGRINGNYVGVKLVYLKTLKLFPKHLRE